MPIIIKYIKMKKVSIIVTVVFMAIVMVSCGKEKESSKIKQENLEEAAKRDEDIGKGISEIVFDKEVHDFGTVNEGDIVEHNFLVTNSGKSNLIITKAKASCGCTVPTWPKEPIAPGESAEVSVKFDTKGKANKQSKTITLTTNTSKGIETVKITGMVTPKIKTPKA